MPLHALYFFQCAHVDGALSDGHGHGRRFEASNGDDCAFGSFLGEWRAPL
jgi:hypothetical protein